MQYVNVVITSRTETINSIRVEELRLALKYGVKATNIEADNKAGVIRCTVEHSKLGRVIATSTTHGMLARTF